MLTASNEPRAIVPDSARHLLEYVAFRAMAAVFALLGLRRSSALSGLIWRKIAPHTHRHAAASRHLEVAFPDLGADERERILRDVWDNLGRTTAETLMMKRFSKDPSRIRIRSPEALELIRNSGGRAVIASMHSGNWEIVAPALKAVGISLAFIYRHLGNPHMDRYLRRIRGEVYPGGLHVKGDAAPRRLISWVKAGNCAYIIADHRVGEIQTPFFDYMARSTPLPAFIARTLDVPLIAVRIVRKEGVTFDMDLEPVAVPKTDNQDRDIEQTMRDLQGKFETWIREYPGQWMWSHRRWSREGPPEGWQTQEPASRRAS